MAAKWIELITGSLEQKKQYREIKARLEALPDPYATVAKAIERYFMASGVVLDGDDYMRLYSDFADLWDTAVADGTPVREIVGDDPAAFAESLIRAYSDKQWIDKQRKALATAIDKAIDEAERDPHS